MVGIKLFGSLMGLPNRDLCTGLGTSGIHRQHCPRLIPLRGHCFHLHRYRYHRVIIQGLNNNPKKGVNSKPVFPFVCPSTDI